MFPLYDLNRPRNRPFVVFVLIGLNLLAFVFTYFISDPAQIISAYGFVPGRFFANPFGDAITVLTSMFLHGSIMHFVGNMWFLWVFGDNIEDRLGRLRFVLFYLLGGVAAALAQGVLNWGSDTPMIGASGAISAVLGAYVMLYPRAVVFSLIAFFPVPVPAFIYLGYWALIQFVQSFSGVEGIAFWAHIGGFVFGLAAARLFAPAQQYSADRYR
jgi:membrane associated rhomboid family serine protease